MDEKDGENALSYTIWDYEPCNTHANGDGWNGEDLSLFSYDDVAGDLDLGVDDPPDMRTLITAGARGIDGWCRPYPIEIAGRVRSFTFDMESTRFTLRFEVTSLDGSRLWQADRKGDGHENAPFSGGEASALIYMPYVHYLASTSGEEATSNRNRLVGKPSPDGEEWVKGRGPAVVDVEIEELSEGRLEIEGQWMRWYYPLHEKGEREVSLSLRKWRG